MSTRATYSFTDKNMLEVCFYIQMDNYPEGAAEKFLNMHRFQDSSGGYADEFFRGNTNAEFTTCHDDYDSTNYKYTMDSKGILITEKRIYHGAKKKDTWELIFKGDWTEFVNQYLEPEKRLYNFSSGGPYNKGIMTIQEAEAYIECQFKTALQSLKNGWLSNAVKETEEANTLVRELKTLKGAIVKPAA